MIVTLLIVLAVLWLLGVSLELGGELIHLLLVVLLVVLIYNFWSKRNG